MYRTNATLTEIETEVAKEFEELFGFSLTSEVVHLIYGSQSLGALHYIDKLEPVKLKGLLILTPSERKLKEKGFEIPKPVERKTTTKLKTKPKTNTNKDNVTNHLSVLFDKLLVK